MAELRLIGCRSRPLLGYLKALGVLRIVSRQVDSNARARWSSGVFELSSCLDRDRLASFLLNEYRPASVVSPWNGGSGFHPNDNKDAILTIEESDDPRLAEYRATIAGARAALAKTGIAGKPERPQKLPLVRELRRTLPDEALPWLDAAIVVTGEDAAYPPLLGSGGIDGRFDFSNNYAQAVVNAVVASEREVAAEGLLSALEGGSAELHRKLSLGHLSRDASPVNSPIGESDSLGNPWDLVLAVEGTLLLVAGAARRHGATTGGALAAPFTARSTAAGYGSAVAGESGRAELWLPLWSGWASRAEIETLARESRAQVGSGRSLRRAVTGLDFARAAGELGVARGIGMFERYAILERAGQSSLAVPAGRVSVAPRPAATALSSIDGWLTRMIRFARDDRCPRAARSAICKLERAAFEFAAHAGYRDANAVVEAVGAVEHTLARSPTRAIDASLRPLAGVAASPWIEAANDGSPEFEVAGAIASLRDRDRRSPALRDYLHGTRDGGFDAGWRDAVQANGPVPLLAALHARRHLDAARRNGSSRDHRGLPFTFGAWCDLGAARMFAAGVLDDERILRLLFGLALLDHQRSTTSSRSRDAPVAVPAFDVLALAWTGMARTEDEAEEELGPRPGWAARLAAGATSPVLRDAMLRLRMAGLRPIPRAEDVLCGAPAGARLGAALLVPLGPRDAARLAKKLTRPAGAETKNHDHQMEETECSMA